MMKELKKAGMSELQAYGITNPPEFLQRALLIGEEEAQQSLPLHNDDDGDSQEAG